MVTVPYTRRLMLFGQREREKEREKKKNERERERWEKIFANILILTQNGMKHSEMQIFSKVRQKWFWIALDLENHMEKRRKKNSWSFVHGFLKKKKWNTTTFNCNFFIFICNILSTYVYIYFKNDSFVGMKVNANHKSMNPVDTVLMLYRKAKVQWRKGSRCQQSKYIDLISEYKCPQAVTFDSTPGILVQCPALICRGAGFPLFPDSVGTLAGVSWGEALSYRAGCANEFACILSFDFLRAIWTKIICKMRSHVSKPVKFKFFFAFNTVLLFSIFSMVSWRGVSM